MDSLPWGKVNIAEKRLRQPLSSTAFFRLDPDHYLTTYNAYSRFALYDKDLNLVDSCTYYSPITTQTTPEKVLENYYFYCSAVLIKPDGTKFLNFTHCGAILEFSIYSKIRSHIRIQVIFMNRLMKQTGFLFGGKVSEDGGQYMPRIITYI